MEPSQTLKIAAVTDDGRTISAHFGRARAYLVCTVDGGSVVAEELRDKAGHHTFAAGGDHGHDHGHAHDHDHDHDHGHDHDHDHAMATATTTPGGHGTGAGAAARHAAMTEPIRDCAVVLARGMGRGAYLALEQAGLEPFITTETSIADAVRAYAGGELVNHTERLH
jgi:predicted Fe-Mo cluster-binding NifX family protein